MKAGGAWTSADRPNLVVKVEQTVVLTTLALSLLFKEKDSSNFSKSFTPKGKIYIYIDEFSGHFKVKKVTTVQGKKVVLFLRELPNYLF